VAKDDSYSGRRAACDLLMQPTRLPQQKVSTSNAPGRRVPPLRDQLDPVDECC